MAITFPYDLLAGFPGWQGNFKLNRRQEISRTAGGFTQVKDFGDPLWTASYSSKSLKPNALDKWRARLDVLDEGLNTFRAYILSRCYPILYPNGSWPTGSAFAGVGAISAIAANRKEVNVSGFPIGYTFSEGDIIMTVPGQCYRVGRVATVTSGDTAPLVEVRPHIKTGTPIGVTASVVRPWVLMTMDVQSRGDDSDLDGRGPLSFTATEALNA